MTEPATATSRNTASISGDRIISPKTSTSIHIATNYRGQTPIS